MSCTPSGPISIETDEGIRISKVQVNIWQQHCSKQSTVSLASFPDPCAGEEKRESGTHCLCMLSSCRISGNLEKSALFR